MIIIRAILLLVALILGIGPSFLLFAIAFVGRGEHPPVYALEGVLWAIIISLLLILCSKFVHLKRERTFVLAALSVPPLILATQLILGSFGATGIQQIKFIVFSLVMALYPLLLASCLGLGVREFLNGKRTGRGQSKKS